MPTVVYLLPDGSERRVDATAGDNLMITAVNNNIRGIDGECGGCMSCATCHVYVRDDYLAELPPAEDYELELLAGVAAERRANSRLGCQIKLSAELDGLVVTIPERQS